MTKIQTFFQIFNFLPSNRLKQTSCQFSHKIQTWNRYVKKDWRDSDRLWWRTIHRKLETLTKSEKNSLQEPISGAAWSSRSDTSHKLSRYPSGLCGSYSTVSKYSSVLQSCKGTAPSDHWWRRYIHFHFSLGMHVAKLQWTHTVLRMCWRFVCNRPKTKFDVSSSPVVRWSWYFAVW